MPKEPKNKKLPAAAGEPFTMWRDYEVELQMTGQFAASIPGTKEEIEKMLENRMPKDAPDDYIPLNELTDIVAEEVGANETEEGTEEVPFGLATFKRETEGLYFEGRCVRGHIKDCANIVKPFFDIRALKAHVANKVYVVEDVIPLYKMDLGLGRCREPDGRETRYIQVMTRQGPRSTIKYIDYLLKPWMKFTLKVLNDGEITDEILRAIFDYGAVHGMGQERSQGWGRYDYTLSEK